MDELWSKVIWNRFSNSESIARVCSVFWFSGVTSFAATQTVSASRIRRFSSSGRGAT